MRRRTTAAVGAFFLLFAAPAALAQQAPPPQDPIAAALAVGDGPTTRAGARPIAPQGGAAAPPTFSPRAISDLLTGPESHDTKTVAGASPKPATPPTSTSGAHSLSADALNATTFAPVRETNRGFDPVVLKAEVLLDRAHAPPGVIDGKSGSNFTKAIKTFEEVRGLEVDGKLTRRVWTELGADTAAPVFGTYTITKEDLAGPFYPDLSPDYAEQAKLPSLGYRSPAEMLAERFHMDQRLLKTLNPGRDFDVAGTTITVAQVETMPIAAKVARIDVDKGTGQVRAYDPDGMLVVAYPATIGSEELPSPSGNYVVRGVAPHPTYTYDPKKNFQQGNNVKKLILPPGPNNPVGSAFIALSKPTYGIHGTPDPTKIDKTHSHGCVRLTNWNAQELSKLVTVGTPVNFVDKPETSAKAPDLATVTDDHRTR